ncbi:MAG: HD domain-containing phosphohydrolase, partial [Sulfurimonadaceae bacterium]|nr:HD domain-containing phosphohydrolase [Sulfurimonadaceae bacterium]
SRPSLQMAAIITLQHHERWDGNGYPNGLKGDDTHIAGRIVALADVFDALSHDRCYKKAWPIDETVDYISEQSGKMFDPDLVELFTGNLDRFLEIRAHFE